MIELSQQYASQGLVVIAFPCNQFLWFQEPGGRESLSKCSMARKFEPPAMLMMDKVNVFDGSCKSGEAHPVFRYLCRTTKTKVRWNFGAYFLVSRTG
eukprot:CAMPEP_0176078188 /NCGR_PEP_ID=MMETSP0120_2-20121206/39100_1 /TAXON_ID=160619 /ORGANISM="Kryptoperidinium foliaceum, Strain CCMP 1326" /LENGTH=96 /DNA_ID=CAMNT_0017411933 /DNA_START=182 /DNA_END=469 /DNA_ORIENTATION=-